MRYQKGSVAVFEHARIPHINYTNFETNSYFINVYILGSKLEIGAKLENNTSRYPFHVKRNNNKSCFNKEKKN